MVHLRRVDDAHIPFSLVSAGEEPAAEEQTEPAPSLPSDLVLEAACEDSPAGSTTLPTNEATGATETEAVEIDAVLEREVPTAPAPPPENAAPTDDSLESPTGDSLPTGEEEEATAVEAGVEQGGAEEPAATVEVLASEIAEEVEAKIAVDAKPETGAKVVGGEDKNACTGECSTEIR